MAALPDVSVDEFDHVLAVNARGTFLGMRGAFRAYRSSGRTGAIVVTASIACLTGSADLLPYVTSRPSGGAGAWSTAAVDRSIYRWA